MWMYISIAILAGIASYAFVAYLLGMTVKFDSDMSIEDDNEVM